MSVTPPEAATRLVWDLPVRLTHWALVLCVAGSWATHYAGAQWAGWHARCGYAVLVLVAFRILWGFVGTRHARFATFVRGPGNWLAYVRSGEDAPAVGHNPLGALSVLAMLAVLLLQAATGLFANDQVAFSGPFFGWVSQGLSDRLTALHHRNANAVLALVVMHVGAIAWFALARRRRLVPAMVTGRRPAGEVPPGEEIGGSQTARAALIVAVLAALLALAIRVAPEATLVPF